MEFLTLNYANTKPYFGKKRKNQRNLVILVPQPTFMVVLDMVLEFF